MAGHPAQRASLGYSVGIANGGVRGLYLLSSIAIAVRYS